jgi:hypothetical protein
MILNVQNKSDIEYALPETHFLNLTSSLLLYTLNGKMMINDSTSNIP